MHTLTVVCHGLSYFAMPIDASLCPISHEMTGRFAWRYVRFCPYCTTMGVSALPRLVR